MTMAIRMTSQETRRTKGGGTRVVPCAWVCLRDEAYSADVQARAVALARAAGYALYAIADADGTVLVPPGLLSRGMAEVAERGASLVAHESHGVITDAA